MVLAAVIAYESGVWVNLTLTLVKNFKKKCLRRATPRPVTLRDLRVGGLTHLKETQE